MHAASVARAMHQVAGERNRNLPPARQARSRTAGATAVARRQLTKASAAGRSGVNPPRRTWRLSPPYCVTHIDVELPVGRLAAFLDPRKSPSAPVFGSWNVNICCHNKIFSFLAAELCRGPIYTHSKIVDDAAQ